MSATPDSPRRRRGLIAFWSGLSPSLVPILAVITAFLAGIPLITITVSDSALQPDIARGLQVSSTAYVALVESITGLTINPVAAADDFDELRRFASDNDITTRRSLSRQARPFERIVEVGMAETREYTQFFARYDLDEDTAAAIAERLPIIRDIGADDVRALKPLLDELADLSRSDVRELAALAADASELSGDALEAAAALFPALGSKSASELARAQAGLRLIDDYGQVSLQRSHDALLQLDALGIDVEGADADTIVESSLTPTTMMCAKRSNRWVCLMRWALMTRRRWARNSASSAP